MAGNATFITNELLLLFVFSLMQAGVRASVPVTEQENEFEGVTGLAERFVVLLFAFYMQYKGTAEIKERIQIAIGPSRLSIFLFSRRLSICSFPLLWLALLSV